MDAKTYLNESARTAATNGHFDCIDLMDFEGTLADCVQVSEEVDYFKKALFYRKVDPNQSIDFAAHPEDMGEVPIDLLHGAMGAVTESGELLSMVVDASQRGFPLDAARVLDEVGDTLWYLAVILRQYGFTFEDAFSTNIEKLKVRFPSKFSEQLARDKDDSEEKVVFSKVMADA